MSLELGSDEATQKTIQGKVTGFQQKYDKYLNKNYVSQLGIEVKGGTADKPLFPEIGGTTINIKSGVLSMNYTAERRVDKEKTEANKENYVREGTFTSDFDADVQINKDTLLTEVRYVAASDLSKTFYTQFQENCQP